MHRKQQMPLNPSLNSASSLLPTHANSLPKRALRFVQKLGWRYHCRAYSFCKRGLDIAVAGGALIALSPLLALTILAIKIESRGSIFFSQTRVGINGQLFKMWKFRSMYQDADRQHQAMLEQNEMAGGVLFKMKRDPRITRVGSFIRKYSIDELPQLWNVLNGTMSLVGPRPALPKEVAQYELQQRQRLLAKPGITCIWQISGRSDIPFKQQVDMDRRYIFGQSLIADIKLMLLTIPAVVTARGAY